MVCLEGQGGGGGGQKVRYFLSTVQRPSGLFPACFRPFLGSGRARTVLCATSGECLGRMLFPNRPVSSSTGSPVLGFTVLAAHYSQIVALDFSPDGQWIVSGSDDRRLRIRNASDGMSGGGCMGCACGGLWQPTPTLPHSPAVSDSLSGCLSPSRFPALSLVPNVCITACWHYQMSLPPPDHPIGQCSCPPLLLCSAA